MHRVLLLGKVWPEPASSAAGSRTMQLIRLFLSQGWQVACASAAAKSVFTENLETLNVETFSTEINSPLFDEQVKTWQPTMVVFDRFTTEEQFGWRVTQQCPNALKVLDTIDLHCLRSGRHAALKEGREFDPVNLLTQDNAARELASIFRSDLSLMVSDVEISILEKIFHVDPLLLHYVPLFYQTLTPHQISAWRPFSERKPFVSIGNFLHEPNWDAVQFLKKEVWPLIRRRLPDAELHIYGAYATQKVMELHKPVEGFLVKGRAGSAPEVMSHARVCLAPLRFGAGIKGKLLDAMLTGTPSITTPIGAEGMHQHLPWNGSIAQEPEELASAAVELYNVETKWNTAQQNGVDLINTIFSLEKHGPQLIEKLTSLYQNLAEHRRANFTGTMLRHQNNAATKYMSLWIEEKNKRTEKM